MNILDGVRDIAELVKKYNDQDLYQRIVDLREQILNLREENLQLREGVKALNEAAKTQDEIVRYDNFYYRKDDTERARPYCVPCWDYERKLVGLLGSRDPVNGQVGFRCHICEARMARGH